MTDTEKTVKINEMVETYCPFWNGNMKQALKKRMHLILDEDSDAESWEAAKKAIGAIRFMEDAFFLSAYQADKLVDYCNDLYFGYGD